MTRCAGLGGSRHDTGSDWPSAALKLCHTRLCAQYFLIESIVFDLDATKFLDNLIEEIFFVFLKGTSR